MKRTNTLSFLTMFNINYLKIRNNCLNKTRKVEFTDLKLFTFMWQCYMWYLKYKRRFHCCTFHIYFGGKHTFHDKHLTGMIVPTVKIVWFFWSVLCWLKMSGNKHGISILHFHRFLTRVLPVLVSVQVCKESKRHSVIFWSKQLLLLLFFFFFFHRCFLFENQANSLPMNLLKPEYVFLNQSEETRVSHKTLTQASKISVTLCYSL